METSVSSLPGAETSPVNANYDGKSGTTEYDCLIISLSPQNTEFAHVKTATTILVSIV